MSPTMTPPPIAGAQTSSSANPSTYLDAWHALRSRLIFLTEHVVTSGPVVIGSPVGDAGQPRQQATTTTTTTTTTTKDSDLVACLKSFANSSSRGGRQILKVIASDVHANEDAFSNQLLLSVVRAFQQCGWNVCKQRRTDAQQQGRKGEVVDDVVILGKKKPLNGGRKAKRTVTPLVAPSASGATAAVADKPQQYVVEAGEWTYAMGISCKAKVNKIDSGSIIAVDACPDHSWVIFKKKKMGRRAGRRSISSDDNDKGWIVHQVLAVVELKMDDSACKSFPTKEFTTQGRRGRDNHQQQHHHHLSVAAATGSLRTVDRTSFVTKEDDRKYGPLGQVLVYVVGHVVWGRSVLGLGLPDRIPFAVVAGLRAKEVKSTPKDASLLRGLHGFLFPPEACGGEFSFGIDAFMAFDEEGSGHMALTSYVSVMASGIRAAEDWLGMIAIRAQIPTPTPMSGQRLMFGSESLDVPLVLSPVARSGSPPYPNRTWEGVLISQGELFAGEVNLLKLQQDVPESRNVSWVVDFAEAEDAADHGGMDHFGFAAAVLAFGEFMRRRRRRRRRRQPRDEDRRVMVKVGSHSSVVVKVSSKASFGQLVADKGFLWSHGSNKREVCTWEEVCRCLSSSLYGIHSPGGRSGLVLIMPDLFNEGFVPLQPQTLIDNNQWSVLWTAFEEFVQDTLIPLAKNEIVHPDLRPGFNCTANLLYHPSKKEIRMIDLDSLVDCEMWSLIDLGNKRYVSARGHGPAPTALEFVLRQSVAIAEAWIHKVLDCDADADGLFTGSEAGREWNHPAEPQPECDLAFLLRVLQRYRVAFGVSG